MLAAYRTGLVLYSPTATQKYSLEDRKQGKPEAVVGCGPFKLVEWVKSSHLVMDRFDKYFEPGLPYLDRQRDRHRSPFGRILGEAPKASYYKEAVPRASRVAVLGDPSNPAYWVSQVIHDTARKLGLKPVAYDARALRCGYGPRLPLLVLSPFARQNFVAHDVTDQSSILRFIEDNWALGRIGGHSFDAVAGSLVGLFDFDDGTRVD